MQTTLSAIILALIFIMTASALVAVVILTAGKGRKTKDNAHLILIITFATELILGVWGIIKVLNHPNKALDFEVLQFPISVLYMCLQALLFTYPIAILRPKSIQWKSFVLMTVPYLIIALLYVVLPMDRVYLSEPDDIFRHIGEPDVLFRVCTLGFFLPYSVMLPFLHIRTNEVNVSTIGIFVYTLSLIGQTLLLSFHILTAIPYFQILYLILGFCNNVYLIYYEHYIKGSADESIKKLLEAKKTISVEKEKAEKVEEEPQDPTETTGTTEEDTQSGASGNQSIDSKKQIVDEEYIETEMTSLVNKNGQYTTKEDLKSMDLVHEELYEQFNIHKIWKRSDLTVEMLAKEIGTNKTYIQKCIKAATGYNCTEYINRERINHIMKELKANPDQDLKKVLAECGYSSRTTAWRNFKKITGLTLTEYVKEIKDQNNS